MEKGRKSSSRNSASSKTSTKDLLSREEEYKRLNEELEAKTANLIKDAEEVIKEQESFLSKPSLLDNINTEDFLGDFADDELTVTQDQDVNMSIPGDRLQISARPASRPASKQPASERPPSKSKKAQSAKSVRPKSSKLRGPVDDVAVPDEAFMTEFRDFSLSAAISNIEGRAETADSQDLQASDDDVMPMAAAEMGAEAQIRFLKAKLRVMQEELDRLAHDCNKKEEENTKLHGRLKELEDDKNRLSRTSSSQQQQIDKYKKLADEAKGKTSSLENQLSGVKKELESLKRAQKQQQTSQGATEVRLNRALEEVEKYKTQLSKSKTDSKEVSEQEKRKVEQLLIDNRRLEKQKNELMTGFKKQLKLIDILKRQKMHIEAAKMLQFSEEEFVKALEWGS